MFLSQNVKYGTDGEYDPNNPSNLLPTFKKPFTFLVGTGNPTADDGTYGDYWINSTTGDLFEKDFDGLWGVIYNFDTGGGGGGITNIENDGGGIGLFRDIIGSTAHFKSVDSNVDEIDIIEGINRLDFVMSPNYVPPLLERFVDSRKIGSASNAPPASADSSNGFAVGDLWTQLGTGNALYLCTDASVGAAVWVEIAPFKGTNVGGGTHIFEPVPVGGNYQFRTLRGVAGTIIAYVGGGGAVELGIDNTYKPTTLALVPNVKNNYTGSPVPPTSSDDSTQGYQEGSIFTTVTTFPTGAHVWVCADATAGSAVWYEISGTASTTQKDFIQFKIGNTTGYTASITAALADFNFGPDPAIVRASKTGTLFSSVFDGTRTVFRRSVVPAALVVSKWGYRVSYSIFFTDFAGATTSWHRYDVFFIRKSGNIIYPESVGSITLAADGAPNRWGCITGSFIFEEISTAQQDYYFRIRGQVTGGGPAPNIDIEEWAVSFNEI